MAMLSYIIMFLSLGFIGLYFGSKLVIIGLEDIANHLGMSHLMVGLTILAIGTSLPEIAVSVIGGLDKLSGIATNIDGIVIGNKVGSFMIQITLILGILGLSQSIFVSKWVLKREGSMLFISLFIFFIFSIDGVINRIEGLIMMIIYFIYLLLIIKSERRIERKKEGEEFYIKEELEQDYFEPMEKILKESTLKQDIGIFLLGLVILLVAAEITVLAAIELAVELRIPPNVIGILIVGLGTSLPELTADLTALRRRSEGIAVGDILGSNICDMLLATGSGAIISEFSVAPVILFFDLPMLLIAVSLAYIFLWTEKTLKKWEALILIGFFGFYVIIKLLYFQI
ncbi:MAG: calcium/sodium antiporter [Promethearchaeota archaeon]|nr:MAG: calcium/sodium antiporter [Candidatus Lokiarchaeota archaeon]